MVEFSDTSFSKDLTVKSGIYANAGIPEYWVVDLRSRKLIVMRDPGSNSYQSRQEWTQGEIQPLSFPEVQISVDALLGYR